VGSDFTLARARASASQFLRVPWTRHAVLALRLSGGVAHGSIGGRAPFTIGGPTVDVDLLSYLLGSFPDAGTHPLRGYAPGALGGSAFYLGTVELRFPLVVPLLGRTTWPLFLRRLNGAVFADAGDAIDRPGELQFSGRTGSLGDLRIGVGAELRFEMVFGYFLRTEIRLGAARPLGPIDGGRARDLEELGEAPAVRYYLTVVPL
jgi:outer membrane protein assembly factor BamA